MKAPALLYCCAAFGIHSIGVRGSRIFLNGRPVKIRGVNRHEDHPEWGSASPGHLVRQDVEIIKRLGANAVRGHCPPTDLFLDYCDQNGLLFLDEVPAWQYRAEQVASPAIQDKIKSSLRGMMEKDGGHASILTWSLGNEWPEPDKSYDVVKSLVEYAHSLDRTRGSPPRGGRLPINRYAEGIAGRYAVEGFVCAWPYPVKFSRPPRAAGTASPKWILAA